MKKTEFEFFTLCNLEYRPKTTEIMTNPSLSKYFLFNKTQYYFGPRN